MCPASASATGRSPRASRRGSAGETAASWDTRGCRLVQQPAPSGTWGSSSHTCLAMAPARWATAVSAEITESEVGDESGGVGKVIEVRSPVDQFHSRRRGLGLGGGGPFWRL